MKRWIFLGAVLLAGFLSIAVNASQQACRGAGATGAAPSANAITVEKLTANLFVLRGGGGITAAS